MSYPELDAAVIAAARERLTIACQAADATKTLIADSEAELKGKQAQRMALIERAAVGEAVQPGDYRKYEEAIRKAEADLLRNRDVLAIQEKNIRQAETDFRQSQSMAHRPKIAHALTILRDLWRENEARRIATAQAQLHIEEAKAIIFRAFGAGYPMPPQLPRGAMPKDVLERIMWADLSENTLRNMWGELAIEAFGPAESAA